MKCPNCGSWNRDTYPRCFRCGTPLFGEGGEPAAEHAAELDEYIHQNNSPKSYIRIDEDGRESDTEESGDELGLEMQNLSKRKESGRQKQRSLRASGASQGIAPSGRNIEFDGGRRTAGYQDPLGFTYSEEDVEGEIRPNAKKVVSSLNPDGAYDDYYTMDVAHPQVYYSNIAGHDGSRLPDVQFTLTRNGVRRRLIRFLVVALLAVAVGLSAYQFIYLPYVNAPKAPSLASQVEITPSILGDSPAHTIKIPGEEGTIIYIKELHEPFTVTGGYATIEVADYRWYEDENDVVIVDGEVTATITPYLKTSSGEQVALEPFTYQVSVPASPLILVSPDTGYAEVSTKTYRIQFRVEKNSTVTINGEDLSDLVSTNDGLISYNANIAPSGNNYFEIRTRCQYYRESTTTVVIYRAFQDIPLDLSETLDNRSTSETMTISATTLPGATIQILTPYENLDTSKLNTTGEFSFSAKFDTIGNNTITITASYAGRETSVVNYDVYYVPPAKDYTRKAWGLDPWNYSELLSSISTRVANSQIYVCKGEIVSIISSSPQLAIMETGDASSSRQVLLENRSTDTWEVGEKYRVYADVYGLYNGIPRLVGRYTYPP